MKVKVIYCAAMVCIVSALWGGTAQAGKVMPGWTQTKAVVDDAYAKGGPGIRAALKGGDRDVAKGILERASITESSPVEVPVGDQVGVIASKKKSPKARAAGACSGAVSRRITVAAAGVTLAWRQVRIGYWCWGGGKITSWAGAENSSWSAFPYCWKDTNPAHGWWVYPTVRRAHNQATLGVNYAVGCISSQTITPTIVYRDGGSYYF